MIGKFLVGLIAFAAGLLLVVAFGLGYTEGQASLCSDFGGVFVEGKCLDKSVLLKR